jgi:long-chain acyl-CoA synthetase
MTKKPWLKFYGDYPHTIDYPKVTLYEALMQTAEKFPQNIAWDFMGSKSTYTHFLEEIDQFADALSAMGFKKGDVMTISMPTAPNGIVPIYAINKLGGVASMIHPLSPPVQIRMFLKLSKSRFVMTLDAFYKPVREALETNETQVEKIILCKIGDYLSPVMKFGFWLTKGRKIPKIPEDTRVLWYKDMMTATHPKAPKAEQDTNDLAIILYSGGTTGVPKGIMLSNRNMISEGTQCAVWGKMDDTDKILAILPIFHGFGLGVCVNAAFMGGCTSILIPTFTPESVAKLINKKKPTFLVGVPTLFAALSENPVFQQADLSCLKATFSGADTLPGKVKARFEEVVENGGGKIKLLEGYGLTEAVTAIMATPLTEYREGSIGIPFPDMLAKIVKMDTQEEVPIGEEGEICIAGPAVMLGYLDNPEATAKVLKKHEDGELWLHTGDVGTQDADGFFYFKLRQKRMLKVSGINVYPKTVEEVIREHPDVETVCVIGVPDKKQISKVKAFVVLKDPSKESDELKIAIQKHCMQKLLKWESPREIEFRKELPLTLVGKVAFNELEKEVLAKLKEDKLYPFDAE